MHAKLPGMVQPTLLLLPHPNLGLLESLAARDPSVRPTHHFHTVWGAYTGVQGFAVHTRTLGRTEQGRGEGGGLERFDSPGMVTWGKDLREEKEPSVERPGKVSQGACERQGLSECRGALVATEGSDGMT